MKLLVCLTAGWIALAPAAVAQRGGGHGRSEQFRQAPKVEETGVIQRVEIAQGQGAPALELEVGGRRVRVVLGSMRYLMEQGFAPKAGQKAKVKGFKIDGEIWAMSVTIEGKTLQLRDEEGLPVWRSGRRGGGWREF